MLLYCVLSSNLTALELIFHITVVFVIQCRSGYPLYVCPYSFAFRTCWLILTCPAPRADLLLRQEVVERSEGTPIRVWPEESFCQLLSGDLCAFSIWLSHTTWLGVSEFFWGSDPHSNKACLVLDRAMKIKKFWIFLEKLPSPKASWHGRAGISSWSEEIATSVWKMMEYLILTALSFSTEKV